MDRKSYGLVGMVAALIMFIASMTYLSSYYNQVETIEIHDSESLESYRERSQKAVEAYREWTVHQNVRPFVWQEYSTMIIFWVSMLISLCGVAFSFWQLVEAAQAQQKGEAADEMEVKTQLISLAFKSRSLASLMLFVSIVYLAIYSIFVYPIEVLPQGSIRVFEDAFRLPANGGSGLEPERPSGVIEQAQ